jgi:hypothetical protein
LQDDEAAVDGNLRCSTGRLGDDVEATSGAPARRHRPAPASGSRRLLRRYDRVRPYAGTSVYIDAERPTAGERLLDLLARGILIEA